MNCRSCRDALTARLDGELAEDERKSVEAHLSKCPDCRKECDSLLFAFNLTERVESIPLTQGIWVRIQSELSSMDSSRNGGFGDYLRTLLVPYWRPFAAAMGAVVVVILLFVSFPSSKTDPALEEEFTVFLQKREERSRENVKILFEPRQNRNYRGINPFLKQVSQERTNPFRE